jgi:hypothetical protein
MCKINAGLFNVPWEDTLRVLKRVRVFSEVADGHGGGSGGDDDDEGNDFVTIDGSSDGSGESKFPTQKKKDAIGGIRSIEVISPPAS